MLRKILEGAQCLRVMQFPSFGKCKKPHCLAFVESSHARLLFAPLALCVRVEHGSTLQWFIHAWRVSTDKVTHLPSRVEYNKPHCLAFVESSHARLLFALCVRVEHGSTLHVAIVTEPQPAGTTVARSTTMSVGLNRYVSTSPCGSTTVPIRWPPSADRRRSPIRSRQ